MDRLVAVVAVPNLESISSLAECTSDELAAVKIYSKFLGIFPDYKLAYAVTVVAFFVWIIDDGDT